MLLWETSLGVQKHNPAWPSEPGAQGMSSTWDSCTLLLWQGWDFHFLYTGEWGWPLGTTSLLDKLIAWLSVRLAQSSGMSTSLSGLHPLELTGSGIISKRTPTSANIREIGWHHKNGSHHRHGSPMSPSLGSIQVDFCLSDDSKLVTGAFLSMV